MKKHNRPSRRRVALLIIAAVSTGVTWWARRELAKPWV